MDGVLELGEATEEQLEELRRRFPDAVAIEPTPWANMWMIVMDGDNKLAIQENYGVCHGDIWPES